MLSNRVSRTWLSAVASAIIALIAASVAVMATPAQAVPNPGDPIGSGPGGIATETTVGNIINVGSVLGGQNPAVVATAPYPAAPGVPAVSETTAQLVLRDINDPTGPIQGLAYCIDLTTETTVGVNYQLGQWTAANVPNLSFVNYILTNYFPNVPTAPAGTAIQKVAAVQAAIWFFTDHFVLAASDPVRAVTAAIIADAQANAAGSQPALPTLTITPNTANVPTTGDIVGPFAVGGTVPSATLQALGVQVFADAQGTQPIADGGVVLPGAQLWMRYTATTNPQGFRLSSVQTVVQGNVFLYDGSNSGRSAAQKLILAQPTDLPIRAGVTATPFDAGAIQITKTVSGDGAGLQGPVIVSVECEIVGVATSYAATIPAGAAAGSYSMPLISGIPAGSSCTLTETSNGANASALLASSTITPSTVTIADLVTATVDVTNVYDPVPTPTPTPTPTPVPVPVPAQGGGEIATTGPTAPMLLAGLGIALIVAGGLVLAVKRREIAQKARRSDEDHFG